MERQDILNNLCWYDRRRSDVLLDYTQDPPTPYERTSNCSCDNCHYGRHVLAEALLEIEEKPPTVPVHQTLRIVAQWLVDRELAKFEAGEAAIKMYEGMTFMWVGPPPKAV